MAAVSRSVREWGVRAVTAHELARKLLAGPDLPVVYDRGVGYGETEPTIIDVIQRVALWQCDIGNQRTGESWSDLSETKPLNVRLPVREVTALRLL